MGSKNSKRDTPPSFDDKKNTAFATLVEHFAKQDSKVHNISSKEHRDRHLRNCAFQFGLLASCSQAEPIDPDNILTCTVAAPGTGAGAGAPAVPGPPGAGTGAGAGAGAPPPRPPGPPAAPP